MAFKSRYDADRKEEASLLLPLCEHLNITVNELLSGERLADNEYKQKAEENMVNMIKEKEANIKNMRLSFSKIKALRNPL